MDETTSHLSYIEFMGPQIVWFALGALVLLGAGIGLGYFIRQAVVSKRGESIESRLKKLVEDSKAEAKEILLEAKVQAGKVSDEAKQDEKERLGQIRRLEERVMDRENSIDKRVQEVTGREKLLEERIEKVKAAKAKIDERHAEFDQELARVAGMTPEDAVRELFEKIERNRSEELMLRIKKMEMSGLDDLERRAKNILAALIQRLASATTSEVTTTSVTIPSDDLKGKIIGREGRNIKSLERAAGVEIIVDDTPGAIVISSFDPIRRQIAKNALEMLVQDGRIQPAKIEETVERSREEIEKQIKQAGEQAAYEVGIFNLDPQIITLLGRLKFRHSYGQNVLQHSIEMTFLAGMLAEEVGADVAVAKKGALLHDIGKAVDHEVTGTHVQIGRRILQKFNVEEAVIKAMQSHHEEYPYETVESIIVQTVDAISASRPGARRDTLETYLKRLEGLEKIANSFEGVEKCYAISAGREIRIFVTPEKINDFQAWELASQIAKKVEEELKYPGEIKVAVIRETRAIEYAR